MVAAMTASKKVGKGRGWWKLMDCFLLVGLIFG